MGRRLLWSPEKGSGSLPSVYTMPFQPLLFLDTTSNQGSSLVLLLLLDQANTVFLVIPVKSFGGKILNLKDWLFLWNTELVWKQALHKTYLSLLPIYLSWSNSIPPVPYPTPPPSTSFPTSIHMTLAPFLFKQIDLSKYCIISDFTALRKWKNWDQLMFQYSIAFRDAGQLGY